MNMIIGFYHKQPLGQYLKPPKKTNTGIKGTLKALKRMFKQCKYRKMPAPTERKKQK